LITVDSTLLDNINSDKSYYYHIISLSIINGIKKLIFVLTKKIIEEEVHASEKEVEKLKSYILDIYQNIKNKFEQKNEINFDFALIDSLEEDGIEELLNKFPINSDIQKENEKNKSELLLFGIYDKYSDKEREEFVITCKLNNENLNDVKNIKIEETKLHCYYVDDKTLSMKQINNLVPFKIGLADGVYISNLENIQNQFLSLKFKLNSIEENFQTNALRNCFLSLKEKDENICFFDTFEAEIIITSLLDDEELKTKAFTVITKGCKCLFNSYNTNVECTIVGIQGEYENNNELVKKKIINCKNGVYGKVVINLSQPILATKFSGCSKFGSFCLLKEGETFAIGKILKYKPKK
jgi:translation elongation factor EF-1alpha